MRYILILAFWGINILFHTIYAYEQKNSGQIEALQQELKSSDNVERKIQIIDDLMKINLRLGKYPDLFRLKADLAISINDNSSMLKAYANLARVYFINNNKDSLFYYIDLIDRESVRIKDYSMYFAPQIFGCMWYINNRNFSFATGKVKHLMQTADQIDSPEGRFACFQIMGLINSRTLQHQAAIENFEKGLAELDNIPNQETFKYQMYLHLIPEYMYTKEYEKGIEVIERFSRFVKEEGLKDKSSISVVWGKWHEAYYNLYLQINHNNRVRARELLNDAEDLLKKYPGFRSNEFEYQKARLLRLEHRYKEAIAIIDNVLTKNPAGREKYIRFKAEVYTLLGDYETAYAYNEEACELCRLNSEKINIEDFDLLKEKARLFQLRTETRNRKLKSQKSINMYSDLVLSLLIILLIVATLVLLQDYRYKVKLSLSANNLKEEKEMLEKTKLHLEDMLEKAETSNNKKNQFLATMSHEIRTPLNSIVGFSDLIAQEESGQEQDKEFAAIIQSNSDLLLKLVNDIVDISREESETLSVQYKMSDIIKCGDNTIQSIQNLVSPDVRVTYNHFADRFELNTDIYRVQQVLTNLLGNAAKFTSSGEINLSISEKDGKIEFAVTDTGCGIPKEKQEAVFNRFEKLEELDQGTGLGLAICRVLAEKLGGNIYIDPSYSKGARFVFEHPV